MQLFWFVTFWFCKKIFKITIIYMCLHNFNWHYCDKIRQINSLDFLTWCHWTTIRTIIIFSRNSLIQFIKSPNISSFNAPLSLSAGWQLLLKILKSVYKEIKFTRQTTYAGNLIYPDDNVEKCEVFRKLPKGKASDFPIINLSL